MTEELDTKESKKYEFDPNSTIISIIPFQVTEFKPGIYPGSFVIPASKDERPMSLIIPPAITFVDRIDQPALRIRLSSFEIAQSVVNDYILSNLGTDLDRNAKPGIFCVPGTHTEKLEDNFVDELLAAHRSQQNWFLKLVEIADDDFAKDQRHIVVSDIQRHACRALGYERPWLLKLKEENEVKPKTCVACYTPVHPNAIICPVCKTVLDRERYAELKLAEA